MSLSRALRAGGSGALLVLILAALLFLSPHASLAEPLGSDIVCKVYTDLNALGDPIPLLDAGNCPGEPPPPPPPPSPPPVACADSLDNDADGLIDMSDPGCSDASDADEVDPEPTPPPPPPETPPSPQCSDGIDNDSDGKVDAEDPGCTEGQADDDETDSAGEEEGSGPEPTPNPAPGPSPLPTPSPSPAPSSGGGGGGGGGAGGGLAAGTTLYTSTSTGSRAHVPEVLGVSTFSTTTESCGRYLTAFIREGKDNDADQVKRLQRFLRDFEGAALSETGTYDVATLAAVHVFQTKYAGDILTPWGVKESTGYVYLTTRKKVNEIYCGYTKTFFLTVEEAQKIERARSSAVTVAATVPTNPVKESVSPTLGKKQAISTSSAGIATSTSQGQGTFERALRFWRGIFDRSR